VPRPKPQASDPCMCAPSHDPNVMCCLDPSCLVFACQEECRANCPAGQYCGNKRIQNREFCEVEVFEAGPKGRGLKAVDFVPKGTLIIEYVGRAVKASKLKSLFRKYQYDRRLYIMALDGDIVLDARHKGGVARFINHSCQPNCRVERWKVKGIVRAAVVAVQDIPAGGELTFDYQWQRQRGRAPTKCFCGTPNCRGTLEVPKSMELSGLEKELEGHWETQVRLEMMASAVQLASYSFV